MAWFDLGSLQDQISKSVEEASKLIDEVNHLDILNFDTMAIQEEETAKLQQEIEDRYSVEDEAFEEAPLPITPVPLIDIDKRRGGIIKLSMKSDSEFDSFDSIVPAPTLTQVVEKEIHFVETHAACLDNKIGPQTLIQNNDLKDDERNEAFGQLLNEFEKIELSTDEIEIPIQPIIVAASNLADNPKQQQERVRTSKKKNRNKKKLDFWGMGATTDDAVLADAHGLGNTELFGSNNHNHITSFSLFDDGMGGDCEEGVSESSGQHQQQHHQLQDQVLGDVNGRHVHVQDSSLSNAERGINWSFLSGGSNSNSNSGTGVHDDNSLTGADDSCSGNHLLETSGTASSNSNTHSSQTDYLTLHSLLPQRVMDSFALASSSSSSSSSQANVAASASAGAYKYTGSDTKSNQSNQNHISIASTAMASKSNYSSFFDQKVVGVDDEDDDPILRQVRLNQSQLLLGTLSSEGQGSHINNLMKFLQDALGSYPDPCNNTDDSGANNHSINSTSISNSNSSLSSTAGHLNNSSIISGSGSINRAVTLCRLVLTAVKDLLPVLLQLILDMFECARSVIWRLFARSSSSSAAAALPLPLPLTVSPVYSVTLSQLQQHRVEYIRSSCGVMWAHASSINGISIITGVLFVYSYYKFRRFGTDAGD